MLCRNRFVPFRFGFDICPRTFGRTSENNHSLLSESLGFRFLTRGITVSAFYLLAVSFRSVWKTLVFFFVSLRRTRLPPQDKKLVIHSTNKENRSAATIHMYIYIYIYLIYIYTWYTCAPVLVWSGRNEGEA